MTRRLLTGLVLLAAGCGTVEPPKGTATPTGKDGLDGIMYDDATDKILTINHSTPEGTATVIDPDSGSTDSAESLSPNSR